MDGEMKHIQIQMKGKLSLESKKIGSRNEFLFYKYVFLKSEACIVSKMVEDIKIPEVWPIARNLFACVRTMLTFLFCHLIY